MPIEQREAFLRLGYTMGGMMVFPANRIDVKQTINGARGFKRRIADRFDLTLECIRRHYRRESSPLAETLDRYASFFSLFGDFPGYVRFFLLDDLVDAGRSEVLFFMPFDDFNGPATPKDLDEYTEYMKQSIDFVRRRNERIERQVAVVA